MRYIALQNIYRHCYNKIQNSRFKPQAFYFATAAFFTKLDKPDFNFYFSNLPVMREVDW